MKTIRLINTLVAAYDCLNTFLTGILLNKICVDARWAIFWILIASSAKEVTIQAVIMRYIVVLEGSA